MLKPFIPPKIDKFTGRTSELKLLHEISQKQEASIITVYGRRRVGKTELIQKAFAERNLLKFEGIEGDNAVSQRKTFLTTLAKYTGNTALYYAETSNWLQVFEILSPYVEEGVVTILLEELQWMANYDTELISCLKHAWDNSLKRNSKLILVLCGSSPSFIIKEVIQSKALYNRANYEIPLLPFSLAEVRSYYGTEVSNSHIMDAYLSVGGIPEYLKKLPSDTSVYLSLLKNSFYKESSFRFEYDKVFVSSLKHNPNYQATVEFLSQQRFASRKEILDFLQKKSGGNITEVLTDLELCQIINSYTPYNKPEAELLKRYEISDPLIQYYVKFIKPEISLIERDQYKNNPERAMSVDAWKQFLGYSFERFCKYNSEVISKILGFNGVKYQVGSYFSKATKAKNPGFQIDLIFSRSDKVLTVCDIKYKDQAYDMQDANKFMRTLELLPKKNNQSVQRVLITLSTPTKEVLSKSCFDKIISVDELIAA